MAKKKVDKDSFWYFLVMLSYVIYHKSRKVWRKLPIPTNLRDSIKLSTLYLGSFLLVFVFIFALGFVIQFLLNILIFVIIGIDNTFNFFHIPLNLEKFEMFFKNYSI